MKRILAVFMVFSFLFVLKAISSTSKNAGTVSMDDIYKKKKIIGKWSEGESPYGISSFEEGGVYKAWAYENAKKEKLLHTMKGKWWIEKGKLHNTVSEITPPVSALKTGMSLSI